MIKNIFNPKIILNPKINSGFKNIFENTKTHPVSLSFTF